MGVSPGVSLGLAVPLEVRTPDGFSTATIVAQ